MESNITVKMALSNEHSSSLLLQCFTHTVTLYTVTYETTETYRERLP